MVRRVQRSAQRLTEEEVELSVLLVEEAEDLVLEEKVAALNLMSPSRGCFKRVDLADQPGPRVIS